MTAPETEHGIAPSSPGDRFVAVLVWIAKVYWYLFGVFFLALLAGGAAYFLGATIREFLWAEWPVSIVQYVAWVAAAAFSAIGQPLGWIRFTLGGQRQEPPPEPPPSEAMEASVLPARRPLIRALRTSMVFGFFGVVCGIVLGGTNAIIWFSIALSPVAPLEWESEVRGGTLNWSPSLVGVIVGFGTVVVMGPLGLLLGGVGSLMGWATETPISDARKRHLEAELAELQRRGH